MTSTVKTMAEWIEEAKTIGDEFKEVNKRIREEQEESVKDSLRKIEEAKEGSDEIV